MGIKDTLFGETRSAISASATAPFIITGGVANQNHLVSASTALRNSDLYAVTSLISADIAGAKFKGDSPVIKILNNPNEDVSRYNFWQTMILNLLLNGNALAIINRVENDMPVSLTPVSTKGVTIDKDDVTGEVTYIVNDFNNAVGQYPQKDVIHIRIMAYDDNYLNSLLGHSPLESLTNEIALGNTANKLSSAIMKNALAPMGILKLPEAGKMSDETKNVVRQQFEKANSGENLGRTIVLDETASFSNVSINADVAKYLTQLDWGRTQITKAYGVPDSFLGGQGDQQSSINMISALYVNGLNKYIEPMVSELNRKLGGGIEFDTQNIIDYSGQQQIKNIIDLTDKGILETTEAHELLISRGLI